jgi:hypothetical protein
MGVGRNRVFRQGRRKFPDSLTKDWYYKPRLVTSRFSRAAYATLVQLRLQPFTLRLLLNVKVNGNGSKPLQTVYKQFINSLQTRISIFVNILYLRLSYRANERKITLLESIP